MLDLQNPTTVKNRLDPEDVQLIDLHTLNYGEGSVFGNTKTNFVTESGFYDVILQSSSSKVKPFRKWVTSEVLPSIRKTGKYEINTDKSKKPTLQDKMDWISFTKHILHLNDNSVLMLMRQVAEPLGLPLPDYVDSKGTLKSATELIKQFNVGIKIQAFNALMVAKGLLEVKTRKSHKGEKKFKALTEPGLAWGENQVTPANPNEVQPRYYEAKFKELLGVIGVEV